MKKLCLVAIVAIFCFSTTNAQGNFNVGVNVGLPTGDVSDGYSFVLGVEANYLFEVSDEFEAGPSASFVNFFGDTVFGFDVPDASFLPIGGAARYNASEKFVVGADLGYAVGISPDGNDGGFYYRPMVGYNISETIMIQATYSGVSVDGGTFSNFGVGASFSL
jgi:hypothetical protein